jgi:hypothetical protein
MKSTRVTVIFVLLIVSFCLAVPGWAKGPVKLKQSSACTGPTIMVGTVSACTAGTTVEVPITINDTAGQPDVSFSVSFDKTKLQYTGKTAGTMGAAILDAGISAINDAGMFQPVVQFAEGGPTSGTICKLKFILLSDIATDAKTDLTIDDIAKISFCGESGAVQCGTSSTVTWEEVVNIYQDYVNGAVTWDEVIAAYLAYVNQQS